MRLLWVLLLVSAALLVEMGWVEGKGEELDMEKLASRDLYAVLGVEQGCDQATVKNAYRKMAKKWHPDKNPNDKEAATTKFAEIGEAYEILGEEGTRRQYDQLRAMSQRGGGGWGSGSFGFGDADPFAGFAFHDPFELFQELFDNLGGDWGRGGYGSGSGQSEVRTSEEYMDYEQNGRVLRQIITTALYPDGSTRQYGQDFEVMNGMLYPINDMYEYIPQKHQRQSFSSGDVRDHHGRGTSTGTAGGQGWANARGGAGGASGNRRDQSDVSEVMRNGQYLPVGGGLVSQNRRFYAVLDRDCDFKVYMGRPGASRRELLWHTDSLDPNGRCFATLQDNGIFAVFAGTEPNAADYVIWGSNRAAQAFSRWRLFEPEYHAVVTNDGNFVVYSGRDPTDPDRECLWGAAGCPGDGVIPWMMMWRSAKALAASVKCQLLGCETSEEGVEPLSGGNLAHVKAGLIKVKEISVAVSKQAWSWMKKVMNEDF